MNLTFENSFTHQLLLNINDLGMNTAYIFMVIELDDLLVDPEINDMS